MSVFDLSTSLERARERLGDVGQGGAAPRSDRGRSRLAPEVAAELELALSGQERPGVREVLARLEGTCRPLGLRCPARATVYQFMARCRPPGYRIEALPGFVREVLYNLPSTGEIPGPQLAFYCFNYGSLAALSFGAGLPWLALYQAARMRGWRSRSRGLLAAVCRVRGI